jgi:thioredoxin reductase (NADPH)
MAPKQSGTGSRRRPQNYEAPRDDGGCNTLFASPVIYFEASTSEEPLMPARELYRVVILGSGPAGLTAAIYASRANLEPLIIQRGGSSDPADVAGGQLTMTTDVDNYPGFPDGIMGPELMDRTRQQAERFGTEIVDQTVEEVDFSGRPFRLKLSDSTVLAETLIIATGARARWLDLPREIDFRMKGTGISACATCDGFFYKGKEVLVIGGGDTAMEEASFLTKFARKVTVVHRRDELRASKIMQERARLNEKIDWMMNTALDEYLGDPKTGVTGAIARNLRTGEKREIAAQGVFMAIGHEPNTALFRGKVGLDENGYVITHGGTTATNVHGVFAAGDVADHRYRQAVTAAATGCMAAIDAERFLAHS